MSKLNYIKFFITLFLISISSIAFSQDTAKYSLPDDLGNINLNGKIKKVIKFYLNPSSLDSNSKKLASISTYNQKMLLVEKANYNEEKELTEKTNYTYNEKNKLIKESQNGMSNWSIEYYYNQNNLLEKEVTENFDQNTKFKIEYKYDHKGNLIEILEFDNNDSIIYKTKNKYDMKNNLFEKIRINEIGGEIKTTYKYDSSGNKIMSIGGIIHKYSYNKDKKLIRDAKYTKKGKLEENEVFKYDKNGLLIEKTTLDEKQKELYKTLYNYDKNGNLFQLIQYDGKEIQNISEFQYEYYD